MARKNWLASVISRAGLQRAWIITCDKCQRTEILLAMENGDLGRKEEAEQAASRAGYTEALYAGVFLCKSCTQGVIEQYATKSTAKKDDVYE